MITLGENSYSAATVKGGLSKVTIGKYCSIAENVVFDAGMQHNTHNITTFPLNQLFLDVEEIKAKHPVTRGDILIGNDVWIGEGALIMGGVTIGSGAVIAAHAVVTKSIPPYAIVGGVPAKYIQHRFSRDDIKRFLEMSWWDWGEKEIKKAAAILMDDDTEIIWEYYLTNIKNKNHE